MAFESPTDVTPDPIIVFLTNIGYPTFKSFPKFIVPVLRNNLSANECPLDPEVVVIPVIIPENPLINSILFTVSIFESGRGVIVLGSTVYPKPGFVIVIGVVSDPSGPIDTVAVAVVPIPGPIIGGELNLTSTIF